MSGVENAEDSKPESGLDGLDEQLVAQLVGRAWWSVSEVLRGWLWLLCRIA